MSISTIMSDIRVELTDEQKTRWSDEDLTAMINKAIRRLNHVIVRNEINFARETIAVEFDTDGRIKDFPAMKSIISIYGLYRKDTDKRLDQLLPEQWETIEEVAPVMIWTIHNGVALYREISRDVVEGKLVYYPQIEIDPVDSPWEGRLDDCIVDYAAFRCKNIDEMNLNQDRELMAELEERIVSNYKRLEQQNQYASGWNN